MMSDLPIVASALELNDDQKPIISLISRITTRHSLKPWRRCRWRWRRSTPPDRAVGGDATAADHAGGIRSLRDESREIRRKIERRRAVEEAGGVLDQDEQYIELRAETQDIRDAMGEGYQAYMQMRQDHEQSSEMRELTAMNIAVVRRFLDRKRELRTVFEEEIMTILVEEQQARLPELARTLRREKKLRRGRLDGESVDLFDVVRDTSGGQPMDSETQVGVDEMLATYAFILMQHWPLVTSMTNRPS